VSTSAIFKLLPTPAKRWIRRRYYRRVVQAYQPSDWEWTPVALPMIPNGGVVYDIGANVGYLSKLFAERVGLRGRVFSVEPIPDTFDALSSSMRTFFPDVVTTFPCCISDTRGHVDMVVPSYAGGGDNFYESHIAAAGEASSGEGRSYRVEALTLDDLVARAGQPPDFIKIDVEGHELSVIRGGRNLFARRRPPLLIEVAGDPDAQESPARTLFAELAALGYMPYTLRQDRIRPREKGDDEVDYLFLPSENG